MVSSLEESVGIGMVAIAIDDRLKVCADMIVGTGRVWDVGTDHAYLPAYLVGSGRCAVGQVVASDCVDGPLEAAAQTLMRYELSDAVELCKRDGLRGVSGEGVSDVIMAGMGAELICRIVGETSWLKSGVNLVLQPMTKVPVLRQWLYANGYEIREEQAVSSGRCLYTVIRAVYTGRKCEIDDVMVHIGKVKLSEAAGRAYAKKQVFRLRKAAEGISRARKVHLSSDNYNHFNQVANRIEELLKEY